MKSKFIVKNKFKILVVFSPIFVANTKIILVYNLKILQNSQQNT